MRLERRPNSDSLQPCRRRESRPAPLRRSAPAGASAALLLVWLAFGARPASAERLIIESRAPDGRDVVLIASPGGTWVRQDDALERLELPAGAWLNRIAALDRGWVAGGARRSDGGQDLFLLADDGETTVELALPFEREGRIRQSVVPLVRTGRLVGVAWLEGDRLGELAVRAATLDAGSWGPAVTVSPPALGGQVALSGAVLADGRPLLVWSRHDGDDSEIVSSLRLAGGGWTRVAPVHEPNTVPDVTPTLIAMPGGAFAAWSFYDGVTMRLRLSRFDGREWTDTGFRGPAASVYPSWTRADEGPRLVFETVVPRGWTVIELDRTGQTLRQATVDRITRERPIVSGAGSGTGVSAPSGASFVWLSPEPDAAAIEMSADWEALR